MTKRCTHPNKEIEAAIKYAETKGWLYREAGKSSHSWGRLLCPLHRRDGHQMSIWSTPRSAYNHAEQIRRFVDQCEHHEQEKN